MWIFPLLAAVISLVFAAALARRAVRPLRPAQGMWTIALLMYAAASFAMFLGSLSNWSPGEFRIYWLLGATLTVPYLAQGELYLTDTLTHLVAAGHGAAAWLCPDELAPLGINTRAELAVAANELRRRINEEHMLAGVTIVDPGTTWIDHGVTLESDAVVHPFTVLRGAPNVASRSP